RYHDDATLVRFLDVFHHRFALRFYRAWADARPAVQHDRPEDDRFATYVGSLAGYASRATRHRDAVPDYAKLFFAGRLSPSAKNAEGLAAILEEFFGLPARVNQAVFAWLDPPPDGQTVLRREARDGGALGVGLALGARVPDAQTRFRIALGPMDLDRYHDFLPGGRSLVGLLDWVRNYVGYEFDWEVQLVLARDEVPG